MRDNRLRWTAVEDGSQSYCIDLLRMGAVRKQAQMSIIEVNWSVDALRQAVGHALKLRGGILERRQPSRSIALTWRIHIAHCHRRSALQPPKE